VVPDGASPVVELTGVGRRFGDVVALHDVSLAVDEGQIVGVIGPSGAGKTTAIRIMTGGIRPSEGTVSVLGVEPARFPAAIRERIGLMPQRVAHFEDLTVQENLDFAGSLFGLLYPRRRRRLEAMLDLLELRHARRRRAGQLSGGEQRRLQLAMTLVHEPDLTFLDEPTAGIDPLLRQAIWEELQRLRDLGHTFVVTTQYVSEAEECDRVALIAGGRLIAFETPDGLRRSAVGGEVLELETVGVVDAASIADDELVHVARQVGPRTIHVVTGDAARATPAIIERVEDVGAEVATIREYRPTFDDVFATLVARAEPDDTGPSRTADAA
jgi:ABC-2 type transport system ATP-binding protein